MFGYIKAYPQELRLRENEYYRAAYCGLCRSMGKCCGCCSRVTLSYDMVFALLVRMAISGAEPEFKMGRCMLHPFKRRMFMKINPELAFTARAATLLAYEKLSDDINDERGSKRFFSRVGRAFLRSGKKRAAAELPELKDEISAGLAKLAELEAKKEPSVDMPAELFGELMANVISHGYEGNDRKLSREIGRRAGRWVYITDAIDDCASDIKKNRYNPFFLLYGKEPDQNRRKTVADALDAELAAIQNALDLIERRERRDLFEILENILRYGMVDSAHRAIYGKDSESERPI